MVPHSCQLDAGLECAHSAVACHVVVAYHVVAFAIAAAVVPWSTSLAVAPVHSTTWSRAVAMALIASILILVAAPSCSTLVLVMMVGQAGILIAADQPLVHLEVARAFPLEAGQRHQLPLLDEEITSVLACHAYFLQLVAHKLTL